MKPFALYNACPKPSNNSSFRKDCRLGNQVSLDKFGSLSYGLNRLSHFGLAVFLVAATAAICPAAPPKVDFFFPIGVRQGETASVTISGTVSQWPPNVWVDREGLTIKAGEKKGELTIAAGPDAAGTYWLRLWDDEGASSLRPFVVGGLPESSESEPNDDPQKPQVLEGPATVNGKLAKRGDVDTFSISAHAGQTLVASLLANNLFNSPMDGVLQVCNQDGFVLAQNDDGRGLDPLLIFPVPREGTYLVRTFAFPAEPNSSIAFAGGENFVYRLTITTGPFVDYALPLAVRNEESTALRLFGWNAAIETISVAAPGTQTESVFVLAPEAATALDLPAVRQNLAIAAADSSPESPQRVELPAMVSGVIESPKDADAFGFTAKKGQKISLKAESSSLGFELDPILQVTDTQGKVLAEADDSGKERDPVLSFTPPADGEFQAALRDLHFHGGPRYVYRLTIEEVAPDYALTLPADSFTLSPGKALEIAVKVDRRGGFAEEIEIAPRDLPPGVSAAPVTSLAKGETAKEVKLTLTAKNGPASGPLAIVGRSRDNQARQQMARFTIPGLTATHTQAWVTVPKPN